MKMTFDELNDALQAYCEGDMVAKGIRFGQYMFNEYDIEIENSYNEKNTMRCYQIFYDNL